MKLTVLSILILLLVAGLAMIQMDANTENQSQVLRETEMLTTQGLGTCQKVVNRADTTGVCADKWCYEIGFYELTDESQSQPIILPIYGIQWAVAYDQCGGFDRFMDCVPEGTRQPCANGAAYLNCYDVNSYLYTYVIEAPDVQVVPGCPFGGGTGGTGGTSS